MGTAYQHQLHVTGGVGGDTWRLRSGRLPSGLAISAGGLVSGLPEQTGTFALGVEASSGSQTVVDTLELAVLAPVLTVADVLQHLVGAGTPLSAQDIVYLDLLGNRNTGLDVGDFLAWVEATGGVVTEEQMVAALAAMQETGRGSAGELPRRKEGGNP
jgi:hypothetical protein